jgi:hypothetical protein
MLETQVKILQAWYRAAAVLRDAASDDDRGEVTAQTALIVLLVAAAIAAGAAIAIAIANNTSNIPSP